MLYIAPRQQRIGLQFTIGEENNLQSIKNINTTMIFTKKAIHNWQREQFKCKTFKSPMIREQ